MESCQVDTAPRPLTDLARRLETHTGFSEAVAELQAGRSATFDGVVGASCALLATSLLRHAPGPLVIVCRTEDVAELVADDLKMFADGISAAVAGLGSRRGRAVGP